MTDKHERLVSILAPAISSIRPAWELEMLRAVQDSITPGGEIAPRALWQALPWQARDFLVVGPVPSGEDAAIPIRVRQPSRLVYLDAVCRVAPSGGPLRATVLGGASGEQVTIRAGQTSGTAAMGTRVPAGALLTLTISEASGAADLRVTAWLVPDMQ